MRGKKSRIESTRVTIACTCDLRKFVTIPLRSQSPWSFFEGLGIRGIWRSRMGLVDVVMWIRVFLAFLQVTMGVTERLRKAILQVAMTPDKNLDALPVLERSLAPVLAVASTIYDFGISVRRVLYHFHILREIRYSILRFLMRESSIV